MYNLIKYINTIIIYNFINKNGGKKYMYFNKYSSYN